MRTSTALQRRDAAKHALVTTYQLARECGLSSDNLGERSRLIRLTIVAPQWVRAYLDGYDAALNDALYSSRALQFGGLVEGVFYSTDRYRPDYYEKHGIAPGDWSGVVTAQGFYWTTTPAPRPFFLTKEV